MNRLLSHCLLVLAVIMPTVLFETAVWGQDGTGGSRPSSGAEGEGRRGARNGLPPGVNPGGGTRTRGARGEGNNPAATPATEKTPPTPSADGTSSTATPKPAKTLADQLREGTVPDFKEFLREPTFNLETENTIFIESMERREESLTSLAPLKLRRYARYLMQKYDTNNDGVLEQTEWEKTSGAVAIDTDGDFVVREDELLFYLSRYASLRTIFRPNPPRPADLVHQVVVDQSILIRPFSAPVQSVTPAAAKATDDQRDLADINEEEFRKTLLEADDTPQDEEATKELLEHLLQESEEGIFREYAVPPAQLTGLPHWFILRDLNGDGQLSLREFAPQLSPGGVALFGRIDSNQDGLVIPDELRAYLIKSGTIAQ